ncbi:hypothetical protein LTR17_013301 [Elasticomyces elasticus]|nr:hypothetical protein LTR17_013301 [Elasticomyces elasticus]
MLQALRRFRAEFSNPERDLENSSIVTQPLTKWLWIDAISINQLDMSERSQQVSRMADVYRLSEQLEIWLGETAQDPLTRELEHELVTMIRHWAWKGHEVLSPEIDLVAELFYRRPWFQRRWAFISESGPAVGARLCQNDHYHADDGQHASTPATVRALQQPGLAVFATTRPHIRTSTRLREYYRYPN